MIAMVKLLNLLSFLCIMKLNTLFAEAANVLAVFPNVWKSHYLFGRELMQQYVSLYNHTVTLITPYESDFETKRMRNIREVRVPGIHQNWMDMGLSFNVEQVRQKPVMERFTRLIYAGATNVDLFLSDENVQKLLQSPEKFDLLVVDLFLNDALLGLAHYYQIPTVVVSPSGANTWLNQMTGNPQNSALDPSIFLPYSERMTFWERSINTLMSIFEKLTYNFLHMISQQTVYEKHFHNICHINKTCTLLPHHRELTKNLSLVLLNSHPVVQYPRAYLPNMIEIGGTHLFAVDKLQLPEHLARFITEAPGGVIYISLGANLRITDLAREKLEALLNVFTALKDMRVLLKWEQEEFIDAHLPGNVFLADWFPQQAVLAHENVKIFITSAGLMSLFEAINFETPLVALPVHPEQEVAAQRLQRQGCAITLSIDTLNYEKLLLAINDIRTNSTYLENIRKLRSLLISTNDTFGSLSHKALQYMQMVLRTGGASHLKSHANQLGFFKTELVDVLLMLLAGISCIIAVPFLVTCCILRKSYYSYLSAMSYRSTINANGTGDGNGLNIKLTGRRSSTSASSSSASSSPVSKVLRQANCKRYSQSSQSQND